MDLADPRCACSGDRRGEPGGDHSRRGGQLSRGRAAPDRNTPGTSTFEARRSLAAWAADNRRRILFTSTDLVFDGARSWYREDDKTAPTLEYGRTKLAAEAAGAREPATVSSSDSACFTGRTITGQLAYFDQAIADLRSGTPRTFFEDEFRTPLDYVTAASILVRLAESDATGMIHVGGPERVSRFELMRRARSRAGS